MAGILVGQPLASGAQQVIVGNPFSGSVHPIGGISLKLSKDASGCVYVGTNLSGIVTVNSGGYFLSGSLAGLNDGVELGPGGTYFVPKTAFPVSGTWNLYVRHEAACSGQARLYYEWNF